ncbi:WD40 repeat domain-containing protein [Planctomycetota bacterium]
MSIEFHCGNCHRPFKVPDDFAGKRAKCKTCGQIVEVPYPAGPAAPSGLPPLGQSADLDLSGLEGALAAERQPVAPMGPGPFGASPLDGPLTPARRKRSDSDISPAVWIAVGGGGAAVLVLAVVMAVMMFTGGPKETASSGDATDEAAASETDAGLSVEAPSPPSLDESPPDSSGSPFGRESRPSEPAPSRPTLSRPTPSSPDTPPAPESATEYVTWGTTEPDFKVKIPDPGFFGTFAFSPPPQPYLAAGANVFNLETGEKVGTIREELKGVERCALSPDGMLFAKTEKKLGGKIDLVLCETGRLSREIIVPSFAGRSEAEEVMDSLPPAVREMVKDAPGNPFEVADDKESSGPVADKHVAVEWLEFVDDDMLLSVVSSHFKGAAFLWDVATGEVKSQFAMAAAPGERCALSDDRKYMASPEGHTFVVRELPKGKIVATMQTPPNVEGARFSMMGCRGVAFSPDGTELAAYIRRDNMVRVICWSAHAKLIFDQPRIRLALSGGVGVGALQWVPDKSGWLLDGRYLLDRESKRLVWQLDQMRDRLGCRFRTKESLLVNRGGAAMELVRMEFPWEEIHDALGRIDSDEPALLRPGGAATLQIQTGTLRYSNPQQTAQELTKVLTERLALDDVSVAPNQPMRLVAFYTEKAGETLKVVEQTGPFHFNVRDTGQTVEETKGRLELKWVDEGGKVVWEREISRTTARYTSEETISSAGLQKNMFKNVLKQLTGVRIPYYIPSDSDVATLPLISKVGP